MQLQMVISTFQQVIKAHLPEDSSRLKGRCHNLKYQRLQQAINGYSHSQHSFKGILAVHSQGIFKRKFQNQLSSVNAPSILIGNQIHFNTVWIHEDLYFNHTLWENHSTQFISHSGRVYTPSDNQYRTTASLKESSSQLFTYTSLL
ncbi:hypothetical protein O181_004612 [Austropuccinia psidii MF-1]|uniref:Uncharacterized protein n=1 Tax=Austropuccinia psidii MF-1 TaxID=1389203 RepID=A0A9Q3BH55_9BASI|nr:hypothetical protein [Austropuccinia psidii MF-1]